MGTPFSDSPHRRLNHLSREWVLVSPHSMKQPWQGQVEKLPADNRPASDPTCYLCPGNERASGAKNPQYLSTFVFTNDFAAILPDISPAEIATHPLLQARSVTGTSQVICFSQRHDLTLPQMEPSDIRRVVDIWAKQLFELGRTYRWVQIFENKGSVMGCSNPHPHGQIWANDSLPNEPAKEDEQQRRYYEKYGQSLLVDCADLEWERRFNSQVQL
jgi:UDPglucose--hexose-1-phosphate uridylyltransferase